MATEAPSSSKIPKYIKAVIFGKKTTRIQFDEKHKPAGMEDIISDGISKTSDQPRHDAFNRAMERMAVHGILRLGFAAIEDRHGKAIDEQWWADHLYEDDPRFENTKATGILITSKKTIDRFQILLETTTEDKQVVKWKSPPISTIRIEGFNYHLLEAAQQHLETILIEAGEFLKGKSSLGQLKMSLVA